MRRLPIWILGLLLVAAACSNAATDDTSGSTSSSETSSATLNEITTTTSPFSTTSTAAPRYESLLDEPPPFDEITVTTEDGVDLYAKLWTGGPVAVLAGHDFYTNSDANRGRNPQSSDTVLWWTGVLAEAGYTVLSPDYRGHGQSPENVSIKKSLIDIKASYQYLVDQGYTTIVMAGLVGSGTAAVVLDATDEELRFDGIAMIWSAPQEVGLDAEQVLYGIDAPVYIVSFDNPRLERWGKLMSLEVDDLYDLYVYPQVPAGSLFADVYGEEFAGRLLDFVDHVAAG